MKLIKDNGMEKEKRRDKNKIRWNKFFIILTLIFTFDYLVWRIFFTIPAESGAVSMIFWAVLLVAESVGLLEMIVHFYNMYDYDRIKLETPVLKGSFPEVDIFVPTVNESTELVEKTLMACQNMKYPDKGKVHIYLCDDGNRPEMEILAKKAWYFIFGKGRT